MDRAAGLDPIGWLADLVITGMRCDLGYNLHVSHVKRWGHGVIGSIGYLNCGCRWWQPSYFCTYGCNFNLELIFHPNTSGQRSYHGARGLSSD